MKINIQKTSIGFNGSYQAPIGVINFELTKLNQYDVHLIGLLKINGILSNGTKMRIYLGQFTLTSPEARNKTISHILNTIKETPFQMIDWHGLIERISSDIYAMYYSPKEAKPLRRLETNSISYLMYPLLPKSVPTLLYAPGGTGKSLAALYIATLIHNGLNFWGHSNGEKTNTLYIDWEMDEELMSQRFSQIVFENIEQNLEPPFYYQAEHNIIDEIEDILINIENNNIGFVVIDSAGMALNGDINDAKSVIQFFSHIRRITNLGITVLIISHVSKSNKEKDDGSLPVGSIFFENLARMTWELKSVSIDDYQTQIILYNRKSNFGRHLPLALNIIWQDGLVFISPIDPEKIKDKIGSTQADFVLTLLKSYGKLTVSELLTKTEIPKQSLWVILNKLKNQGYIKNTNRGEWEYVMKEEEVNSQ